MRAIQRQDLVGVLAWILTAELVLIVVEAALAPPDDPFRTGDWISLAVTALLAALHWRLLATPPRWLGGLGLSWVELSILTAIATAEHPGSGGFLHVLLVWVGVLAFGFLPRRQAWAHTTVTLAATVGIWVGDSTSPDEVAVAGVLLVGTVGGVGVLVSLVLEEARAHSRTDVLTGIANRRGILAALEDAADRAARSGRPLAVLVLDLDDFKVVNDAHGHAAGDALLRRTTEAWQQALRELDSIGRLGGDEFLVVLPDADDAAAARIATRLTALTPTDTGVTIGHATLAPGESVGAALHRADERLYAMKSARRPPPSEPDPVPG